MDFNGSHLIEGQKWSGGAIYFENFIEIIPIRQRSTNAEYNLENIL